MSTSAKGLALVHKDDYYQTPDPIYDNLEKDTGLTFELDVACNINNAKCQWSITEEENALTRDWLVEGTDSEGDDRIESPDIFLNPPRSINGKFVDKAYEQWKKHNLNIVMMLCWNDLGNKYGKKLFTHILNGDFEVVENYGKIKFNKNNIPSEYVSRLTYFSLWFKKKP